MRLKISETPRRLSCPSVWAARAPLLLIIYRAFHGVRRDKVMGDEVMGDEVRRL